MRNTNETNTRSAEAQDAKTYFEVTGTVRDTYDGKNAQYATFQQKNGQYYENISVTIPNDLGTLVDIGDKVKITGYIKSFYNKQTSKTNIVLMAKEVTATP